MRVRAEKGIKVCVRVCCVHTKWMGGGGGGGGYILNG